MRNLYFSLHRKGKLQKMNKLKRFSKIYVAIDIKLESNFQDSEFSEMKSYCGIKENSHIY